jgi:hypothetical protein
MTASASAYRPRSIATRRRRSAAALADLLHVVVEILDQQSGPISIRHLFYLTVSVGAVEKTERDRERVADALADLLLAELAATPASKNKAS